MKNHLAHFYFGEGMARGAPIGSLAAGATCGKGSGRGIVPGQAPRVQDVGVKPKGIPRPHMV